MLKNILAVVALVLALFGGVSSGVAADTRAAQCQAPDCNPRHMTDGHHDFSILTLVDKTHTSVDHGVVAGRYQEQAAELEAQAASYSKLAAKYREDQGAAKDGSYAAPLAIHCENVAKHMREAAAEARELARLHRDLARPATGKAK